MKFKALTVVCALLIASVAPVFAAQEQYKCEIKHAKDLDKNDRVSWINGPVYLWIEKGQNKAHLSDPAVHTAYGAPIEVKVQKNTDRVFRANWLIENGRDSKGRTMPKFRYSMILQKGSGAMQFYAKPIGYSNSFGENGVCKPTRLRALPQS